VRLRLLPLLEPPGRLDDDVDAELTPRKVGGISDRERPQRSLADADRLGFGVHAHRQRAEHGVEREQVRHRLRVADIVDGNDLEAGLALQIGAEEVPADPPETVDRDAPHRRPPVGIVNARLLDSNPASASEKAARNFPIASLSSVLTTSS